MSHFWSRWCYHSRWLTLCRAPSCSTETMSWYWCSPSLHSRQTHTPSSLQNSSSSRSCFSQTLFSRSSTGSISLCRIREGTLWWGSRWTTQYEVRHTRQDFMAFNFFSTHTSHTTTPPGAPTLPLVEIFLLFIWTEISSMAALVEISGRTKNLLSHTGQWQSSPLSQWLVRQLLQKLWPHGVVTGSVKTSRQMEHSKLFPGNWTRKCNEDILESLWMRNEDGDSKV